MVLTASRLMTHSSTNWYLALMHTTPSLGDLPGVSVTAKQFQANASFAPDKTALWLYPESEDGWTHAHNAIRGELGVMWNILDAIGDKRLREWEVSSLQAWWAGHVEHLHDHHANEDAKFTPYMSTRIHLPAKLTSDHVPLVRLLDSIGERIGKLREGDTLKALRRQWASYDALMLPHLHEEELIALPLLRAYFTPAEVGALVESILSNSPQLALGSFFHFMGGTRAACAKFMANEGIPFFVWFIAFQSMVDLYQQKMVRHADALVSGVPPPPVDTSPSVASLVVAVLAVVVTARAYRRWRGGGARAATSTPTSPALRTLSTPRTFARKAGCPSTPKLQGGAFKAAWPTRTSVYSDFWL